MYYINFITENDMHFHDDDGYDVYPAHYTFSYYICKYKNKYKI